jgi:hypothetical protein
MRQTPNSIKKGETMKAYGITAEDLRDLVDAVAIVEKYNGERLEEDMGGVLDFFYHEEGLRPLDAAVARIAIALGDDRPEFYTTLARVGR